MLRQNITDKMGIKINDIAESILGRDLTEEDGINHIIIESLEKNLGQKIPPVLKQFYTAVGNLDMFMSSFESFPEPYIVKDKIVFLEENQGVCFWGVNRNDVDNQSKIVYVCTDIEAENPGWYSEEVSLSDFLEIVMYYQCTQGGYKHGSAIYKRNFNSGEEYISFYNHLIIGWEKVVAHNGLIIYQKNEMLIWHFTDKDGNLEDTIFASTLTDEKMKELEPYGFTEL